MDKLTSDREFLRVKFSHKTTSKRCPIVTLVMKLVSGHLRWMTPATVWTSTRVSITRIIPETVTRFFCGGWSFHPVLIKFSTKPRGLQSPACPFRWLWLIYPMIDPGVTRGVTLRRGQRKFVESGWPSGPVCKRDEKCTIDTVCALPFGQDNKKREHN